MSTPSIGEIRVVSFGFAPRGWATCDGQTLSIAQNQALFSILGTTYGGNGVNTFALPDFRGRIPVHIGSGYQEGQSSGQPTHTLLQSEMPVHTHVPAGSSNNVSQVSPDNAFWAVTSNGGYSNTPTTTLAPQAIAVAGASQPHDNMSPYLTVAFCIALQGIFPSRN
jgi:microcystin-dependent protein